MNKGTKNNFRHQLLRYVRCYLSQINDNEPIGHHTDAQVDQLISTTNVITVLSRRRWYYKGSGHNSSAVFSFFLSLAARSSTMISQRQWVVIIRQLCCSSSSYLQFVRPRWYHKGSGHSSSAVLSSSSASHLQDFHPVLAPGENDIWRSPTKLQLRWVIRLVSVAFWSI